MPEAWLQFLSVFVLAGVLALIIFVLFLPPLPLWKPLRRLRDWLAAKDEKTVFLRLLLAVILSRIALFLFSAVVISVHYPGQNALTLFSENGDIPHYIWLAEHGYTNTGENQNLIVFYPLFPLLIRLFHLFVGDYFLSGVLLSNIATVAACGYFYKLIRLDYDQDTASDGVLLLLLYPFAMFLLSCYTEGVFILLSVMTAYYARRSKWIAAGILGMLAALTKNQGIILFGLAFYEYAVQAREKGEHTWRGFFKALSWKGAALLLIPFGLLIYLYMNYRLFGDWFKFMEFQKAAPWYNGMDFFPNNLAQHINMAKDYPGLGYIIYIPQVALFFSAVALTFYGAAKKVRTSYLLHILAFTLVSFSSSWLISGPRYMLSCVFMFVPLAVLAQNKTWRAVLLAGMSSLSMYYLLAYLFKHAIM